MVTAGSEGALTQGGDDAHVTPSPLVSLVSLVSLVPQLGSGLEMIHCSTVLCICRSLAGFLVRVT